jgi:hypothetical protein
MVPILDITLEKKEKEKNGKEEKKIQFIFLPLQV